MKIKRYFIFVIFFVVFSLTSVYASSGNASYFYKPTGDTWTVEFEDYEFNESSQAYIFKNCVLTRSGYPAQHLSSTVLYLMYTENFQISFNGDDGNGGDGDNSGEMEAMGLEVVMETILMVITALVSVVLLPILVKKLWRFLKASLMGS